MWEFFSHGDVDENTLKKKSKREMMTKNNYILIVRLVFA
jgi:hypothetical protein